MKTEEIIKRNEKLLLKAARYAIENYVREHERKCMKIDQKELDFNSGVFVTINENNELRGCIGIPYPEMKLMDALCEAAISATEDPRFLPLKENELSDIKIEISILTQPEKIEVKNPEEYLDKIKEGEDGLIIEEYGASGLFLPQVWQEIPEKERFLDELCLKAGLPKGEWRKGNATLYRFHAYIVKEE